MQAFKTVELLEHIVAFLPYNDLRNVNRVSKTWSNVVKGSIELQRQLFLKPDPASRGRPIYVRYDRYPSPWPWGDPDFEAPAENDADYTLPESHVPVHVMTVHPSLERRRTEYEAWDNWHSGPVCINITFPWELREMLTWAEGGEWERTFLTQPPCKSLVLRAFGAYSPKRIEKEVQDEGGVRLGMVVQRLRQLGYHRYQSAKKASSGIDSDLYEKVTARVDGFMLPNGSTVQQARLRELKRRVREEEEAWAAIAAAEARRLEQEMADVPDVPPLCETDIRLEQRNRVSEKHPDGLQQKNRVSESRPDGLQQRSAKRRRIV